MPDTPPAPQPSKFQLRTVRIANNEIVTIGLASRFWSDLHHRALTVGWPAFFLAAAAIFLGFNCLFAVLYFLGDKPIANVEPGNFLGLLFFSIETLATVGYGDMHPQTNYAHLIATVEIFTGISLLAVMTGLVFARFSQPRARFIFSRHPVVSTHEGAPTLMIRMANARHNSIAGATAKLWLVRNETSAEGGQFRRFHELRLERHENPVFALSWTIFHTIDGLSPLAGCSAADLARDGAGLALTVTGFDENSAQPLNSRHAYGHEDLRWQHRLADIFARTEDGRLLLDYRRFHDITPDDG